MNSRLRKELAARFGDRVSFEITERMVYSHDTASLPGMVKQMLKTLPDAVIQPLHTDDIVFITNFSRSHNIPSHAAGCGVQRVGWGDPDTGRYHYRFLPHAAYS